MLIFAAVINEPEDVIGCEGASSTSFTCVLNGSISSDDVQWYRLLKDSSTTERVNTWGGDMIVVPITINNSLTTTLFILNPRKSHTGYYWVRLPSDVVCNVPLTITSMYNIHNATHNTN